MVVVFSFLLPLIFIGATNVSFSLVANPRWDEMRRDETRRERERDRERTRSCWSNKLLLLNQWNIITVAAIHLSLIVVLFRSCRKTFFTVPSPSAAFSANLNSTNVPKTKNRNQPSRPPPPRRRRPRLHHRPWFEINTEWNPLIPTTPWSWWRFVRRPKNV